MTLWRCVIKESVVYLEVKDLLLRLYRFVVVIRDYLDCLFLYKVATLLNLGHKGLSISIDAKITSLHTYVLAVYLALYLY